MSSYITVPEVQERLALQVRIRRLSLNYSQRTLADKADVSLGTLKRFEQNGQISLEALLKLSLVLNELPEFMHLFKLNSTESAHSIEEILIEKKHRLRGRK